MEFGCKSLVGNIVLFGERWIIGRRETNSRVAILLTQGTPMCPNILTIVEVAFVYVFKLQTISSYHFCYIFIHKYYL